jgi:putative endonuclease
VKTYYVYVLTNRSGTLYVGVTSNLLARLYEHRTQQQPGFVSKYKLDRLIYYEEFSDVANALAREKQIKGWRREKKLRLIASLNPEWRDLSQSMIR